MTVDHVIALASNCTSISPSNQSIKADMQKPTVGLGKRNPEPSNKQ
jgi:hypothetical protein